MTPAPDKHILVNGIVSARDHNPYVQMDVDGRIVQLSVAAARKVAADIVQCAARAEADSMIRRFFRIHHLAHAAANALMSEFREFRAALDRDEPESFETDPETGARRE